MINETEEFHVGDYVLYCYKKTTIRPGYLLPTYEYPDQLTSEDNVMVFDLRDLQRREVEKSFIFAISDRYRKCILTSNAKKSEVDNMKRIIATRNRSSLKLFEGEAIIFTREVTIEARREFEARMIKYGYTQRSKLKLTNIEMDVSNTPSEGPWYYLPLRKRAEGLTDAQWLEQCNHITQEPYDFRSGELVLIAAGRKLFIAIVMEVVQEHFVFTMDPVFKIQRLTWYRNVLPMNLYNDIVDRNVDQARVSMAQIETFKTWVDQVKTQNKLQQNVTAFSENRHTVAEYERDFMKLKPPKLNQTN